MEEKEAFKKRPSRYVDKHIQQQQHDEEKEGFTMVSLDESFFVYDTRVRRVWINKEKRPVVRIIGSHKHKHSCLFGAISIEGNEFLDSMISSMAIHFYLF